jgi:hypothetical protein
MSDHHGPFCRLQIDAVGDLYIEGMSEERLFVGSTKEEGPATVIYGMWRHLKYECANGGDAVASVYLRGVNAGMAAAFDLEEEANC